MFGDQIRAARNALGWTQSQLAERASIGLRSVRRIEAGEAPTQVVANAVRAALREAGVVPFADPAELAGLELAFGVAILKEAEIPSGKG